jgi:hypothetical protein
MRCSELLVRSDIVPLLLTCRAVRFSSRITFLSLNTVNRPAHTVALVSIFLTQCLLILPESHLRSRELKSMTGHNAKSNSCSTRQCECLAKRHSLIHNDRNCTSFWPRDENADSCGPGTVYGLSESEVVGGSRSNPHWKRTHY